MPRVCACHGPWQLIMLAAALETEGMRDPDARRPRTVLALSGERLTPALRETMERLAERLPGFDDVRWIDDILEDVSRLDRSRLGGHLDRLGDRLGLGDATEVWSANPRTPLDRALFERYPRADVVVFEDGLGTYAAPWSEEASLAARALETAKATVKALTRRGVSVRGAAFTKGVRLLGQGARRPRTAYLALEAALGTPPPYRGVSRSIAPATLGRAVERAGAVGGKVLPSAPTSERRALVLGAAYSFWGAMSRDAEEALYARSLGRLDAAGFELWWKEHPRVHDPFLPSLRRGLGGAVSAFHGGDALPVEVRLRPDAFDLVVAGTSTSLFYVPLLFPGAPVATFADEVLAEATGIRRAIAELVLAHVPTLDAVLAALPSPAANATASRTAAVE